MTSINDTAAGTTDSTAGDMLAGATRNAGRGSDLAMAAGQVIAKRVALGMAAAMDPLQADHVEFARIVPEKIKAFSDAGMIMLEHSDQAGRHISRAVSDEVTTTAHATMAMAACANPAALILAQGQFAMAWFSRAAANALAMGVLALDAQHAAMSPILHAVTANVKRLG